MATKYYCDVCGEETRVWGELRELSIDYKTTVVKEPLCCDICEKCLTKLIRPIKEFHSVVTVKIEADK